MGLRDLEDTIISRAIIRGGIHFYKYEDALILISICEQNNRKILCIDSFIVSESTTQPFLEHSIDFSNIENIALYANSFESAKEFLRSKMSNGFVFEVVYSD